MVKLKLAGLVLRKSSAILRSVIGPTTRLADWMGRKVETDRLEASQTDENPRVAGVRSEFAGHPSRGLTPASLASILSDAEQDNLIGQLDLFEDMEEKDAHIFTELSKRKRALLGLDWDLVPPRNATPAEDKITDQVREWLTDLDNFESQIFDMADAIGKGFSNLEIEWRSEGSFRLPHLIHRPARWFTVNPDDRDQLQLRTDSGRGEDLWPFGWVSHKHKAKSGYIARANLHRVLAWPYLFKNYSIRDLAEFLEIYGIPARIGTYANGSSDAEKAALLQAVVGIGHNAAGIMPEGMAMDFKTAAAGQADPFQAMINWAEGSQSKAILGGTLTTNAENTGLGSGLGDVHNEVRHDLLVSDAKQIGGTLTRDLIWPMIALNIAGANPARVPRFEFNTQEPEDVVAMAEALPKLVGIGFRIPRSWAHDKIQIPEAEDDEEILSTVGPAAPPPLDDEAVARLAAAAAAARQSSDAPVDDVDRFADRMQADTQPGIDALIDQVRELLDEVASLGEFQDRLAELYADTSPDELAAIMQMGMAAADLAGRFDVEAGR